MRVPFVARLTLAVSILAAGSAQGENWQLAATDPSGIEHLVDYDSLRTDGDYVTAWVREKLQEPIYRGLLKPAGHERIAQNAFDCKHGSMATLGFVVRGKDGQTLDNVRTERANVKFQPFVPGSVGEQLIRAVCARHASALEVNAFASDPAHPFFDEVADDIVAFVRAGDSLSKAYEKAVWANPVTREKEIARQQAMKDAQAQGQESKIGFGTAWLSDTGYLVTAYHVIDGAKQLTVVLPDKSTTPAEVVLTDPANDLAVLSAQLPASASRGLVMSKAPVSLGTAVFTVGFPHPDMLGLKPKFTSGHVSSLAGQADDPRILQISTPVQAGNSGGPLVNQSGEVVGIISAKLSAAAVLEATGDLPQNVNFAVKSRYLQGLLADAPKRPPTLQRIQSGSTESIVSQMNNSVFLLIAQ